MPGACSFQDRSRRSIGEVPGRHRIIECAWTEGGSKPKKSYVQERDGQYWITGTHVLLDSVVLAFRQGLSAETIARQPLPSLTLEQVYGAIAFYLCNLQKIDEYMK
jgi:uncharacterized protein (DUF433 family)